MNKRVYCFYDRGFTLVELLVVMTIIIILAIVGMVVFQNLSGGAQDGRRRSDIMAISKTYEAHFDVATGQYLPLQDSWFVDGKIPTPPEGGTYPGTLASPSTSGFQICAFLETGLLFCKQSSQAPYSVAASPSPSPSSVPAPTATPNPTATPTSVPTALPTLPPAPTCLFSGLISLGVGVVGTYTSTVAGAVDTYVWDTPVLPLGSSVTYSPNPPIDAPEITWSADTAGSYTLQLTVNGPGGTDACAADITVNPSATATPTPTPVPTPTPIPTPTPAPTSTPVSGNFTLGETNILGTDDSGNGGLVVAQQVTLSQQATLQSLSFYVNAVGGRLQLGVYRETSGNPSTLVASTPVFTPVVGWNTQNVTTPVVLSAGNYWLAYLPESSSLHFPMTQNGSGKWFSAAFGSLPTTFSSSAGGGAYHWSFYATLNAGS